MMFKRHPIFIIAHPRSGSTMLRLMINSHPNVVVPPECGFIQWLHKKYGNWSKKLAGDDSKIKDYLIDLQNCKKIETWGLDFARIGDLIAASGPENYAQLSELVVLNYLEMKQLSALRWGDKNNYYIEYVPTLATIYPSASFIYLIRDPRDVISSQIQLAKKELVGQYRPRFSTNVAALAGEWRDKNLKALSDMKSLELSFTIVQYESLVRDQEETLRSICRFLNEPYHDEMRQFHLDQGYEPSSFGSWKHGIDRPIYSSSIGKYRQVISDPEAEKILEVAGDFQDALHENGEYVKYSYS